MKQFLFLITLAFSISQASAQVSQNMNLLSTWRNPDHTVFYNDIWGYAANNREYAIIGSNTGTYFIDVTNPTAPVVADFELGKYQNTTWRDFKTYSHYAYGVGDDGLGVHSLQIFDLQYLPDSVHKVYDSNALSEKAHTVFIENGRLYLVSNTKNGQFSNLDVYSLANPVAPAYLGSLNPGGLNGQGLHAISVKNDTAYCSFSYAGLFIYNLADMNNPQLISSITSYPGQGYNHSAWVSKSSKKMIMTDEVPGGLPVKLFDMTDPTNPVYQSSFTTQNPQATPHNTFIYGENYAVLSYYHEGVQVFDISNPNNVTRVGFYDTYPDNPTDFSGYKGCWGVYPFLPSGNIIASDITYGLFVMSPPYAVVNGVKGENAAANLFSVYPNPTAGTVAFSVKNPVKNLKLSVYNTLGQELKTVSGVALQSGKIDLTELPAGMYMIKATGENFGQTKRILLKK